MTQPKNTAGQKLAISVRRLENVEVTRYVCPTPHR